MSITKQAQEIAAVLVAAGVRAGIDPSNIQPPCVLVEPDSGEFTMLGPGCTAIHRYNLWVILPGARIADSMPIADQMIGTVLDVGLPVTTWSPGSIPWGDGLMPALRLPIEIAAPWAD